MLAIWDESYPGYRYRVTREIFELVQSRIILLRFALNLITHKVTNVTNSHLLVT